MFWAKFITIGIIEATINNIIGTISLTKIESDKKNALLKFLNPIEIKSVTPTVSPRESFNIHAVKPYPRGIVIIAATK